MSISESKARYYSEALRFSLSFARCSLAFIFFIRDEVRGYVRKYIFMSSENMSFPPKPCFHNDVLHIILVTFLEGVMCLIPYLVRMFLKSVINIW